MSIDSFKGLCTDTNFNPEPDLICIGELLLLEFERYIDWSHFFLFNTGCSSLGAVRFDQLRLVGVMMIQCPLTSSPPWALINDHPTLAL